jgi:KaiC/GvpD/RAD55 family RecA-like ATPase
MIPKRTKTQLTTTAQEPFALQNYEFNFKQTAPAEDITLTIGGKKIASLGGLVVLTGKPKARKSTFLHSFLASAITYKEIYTIQASLPDQKKQVVLIDTEQSNYDLYRSISRFAYTINADIQELPNLNFKLYTTRLLGALETITLIDNLLENNKEIGVLAIDSLLDLCNDINEVTEAKSVIQRIKFWLDTYKITIITVIHQSKSTNFSLGHLGSFASRFCQSELSIEKNEDLTSTLKPVYLRSDENFTEVNIKWNEENKNYQQVSNIKTMILEEMNHSEIINKIFAARNEYTYKSITEELKNHYPDKSNYWIINHLVPYLYAQRFIAKHQNSIIKVR